MRRQPVGSLPSGIFDRAAGRFHSYRCRHSQPNPDGQRNAALHPYHYSDVYSASHGRRDLTPDADPHLDAPAAHTDRHRDADPASDARRRRANPAGADLDVPLYLGAAARGQRGAS